MKKLLLFGLSLFFGNLLIGQCPPPGFPPTGDTCPQAPALCTSLNGYCDTLGLNNVTQTFPGCPSSVLNNDEWFAFVAGSTSITLQITPSACQGLNGQFGMQGAIYEGSCTGTAIATQCNCTTTPFQMTANNFQIGQTYYVVFDGCAGDVCAFTVDVISGSTIPSPPQTPSNIIGPTQVCPGAVTSYTVPNPSGATYTWTLAGAPSNVGTIVGLNEGPSVQVAWNTQGNATLCVTASNACFANPVPYCINITSQNLPQQHQYYDLCVGDCVTCAGQQFCAPAPGGVPVTLQSWLGCDSVIVCHINGIPPIQTQLGQINMCAPNSYQACGNTYTQSGIYTAVCTSYQGCDSTVIVDLAIMDPQVNILPPAALGCDPGATVTINAANSTFNLVPGGQTIFQWTGPGIVGPNNDVLVTVNQPGQYCLTLTHSRGNVTCTDQACVTVTQNTQVPNAPNVTGNMNPCQGSSVTYTVSPVGTPAPTGYTVTTPNGEPVTQLTATTYQVLWNNSSGGQLCVTADNGCGSSTPTCLTININPLPEVPVLTGSDSVCTVNMPVPYTVDNPQSGVTYTWTVPAGASFSGSGDSISVNYNGATPGTGQVCVTAANSCGSQQTCVTVVITQTPVTPMMSGPTPVCSSATEDYTVSNPQAGVTYTWTAPPGATINGSGSTVSIDFFGASNGQVCVTASNPCGTSSQTCQSVTVIPAPSATISGGGSFCVGSGDSVEITIDLTGVGPWDVEYSVDGGAPIALSITSTPYTFWASVPGTYELVSLATSSSSCPGAVNGSAVVSEDPLPTATLSGSGAICQGSGQTASLSIDLTGAAPWVVEWAVNGNAQAPLNINATPYTLTVGQAQAGNITLTSVTDDNGCVGTGSGSATVVINTTPTVSGIQTGCDPTNTMYQVTFTINGGDPGSYMVEPANGTLTGNTFTSNFIPSGTGYSFNVFDGNHCDTVVVSQNAVICNCTSSAGETDQTAVNECGDGPVTVAYDDTNENFDGNDTLNFVLHSGTGVTIVPPVIYQGSDPTVSFNPATMTYGTTYYLSAVVGDNNGGLVDLNDPCLDVSQGTPITFFEIPTATLSGTTAICLGNQAALTIDFTGVGPWSITYDRGDTTITLNGITSNPFILNVSPNTTTTYCLTGVNDVNCPGTSSGCAEVTVHTGVTVSGLSWQCNPTATHYTVTFTISGGDPASYFVTGLTGTISPTPPYVFTSDPIPTGTGFSATIDDANGCTPRTVSQAVVNCPCVSDAGSMNTTLIEECGDGPVNVGDATGVSTDPDDLHLYYLHTNSGSSIGTIVAISTMPEFSFDPATMTYGTTYYVSSVVGNDDGNGAIDLADPCLSVTAGTPLVFYEIPTASMSGTTEVCPGEAADLVITLTGDSPWEVVINGQTVSGINNTPFNYSVSPLATTVYELTSVSDEHCSAVVSDFDTVSVHDAPVPSNLMVACNSTNDGFTVSFDITGGDSTCYQVMPANGTITNGQFVSNVIPDLQGYSFAVSDCHGCPAIVVSDTLVDCACTSFAGDMETTQLDICGSDVAAPNYLGGEVLDGNDVICFMLHAGDNVPIATNSTGQFVFNPVTMVHEQTYYISAMVGNDDGSGCVDMTDDCLSIGAGAPVVFHAIPTALLTGDATICAGGGTDISIALTGVGPWDIVYTNAAGTNISVTANSSPHLINVTPANSNVYSLVSVSDAHCNGTVSGNATVTVNNPPQVVNVSEACDQATLMYSVSFDIVGGDATSYSVTPANGTLLNGTFTSDPIASNTPYSFFVDDANGCGPVEVSGVEECSCVTDAGTMGGTVILLCEGETANAQPANGVSLDGDDILVYMLHDNSGATLGNVLATNTSPSFPYMPGVTIPGVTYYISAVAGNDDGTGNVDPNDICFDMAPGTPVVFNPLPTVSLTGNTTICEGENAQVGFSMTGTGPFTVTFTINGTPTTLPDLPANFAIEQAFTASTTVSIVSVTDQATGCFSLSSESVTINVSPSVDAGEPTGSVTICEASGEVIDLNDLLTGADPGGTWTGPGGAAVPNGILNTNPLPAGTHTYTYTLTAQAPCPDDAASVQVIISPKPVADAGPPTIQLDCDIKEITLGGPNTTPGMTYLWTGGPVSDSTIANPTTDVPGTYVLTVTSPDGCVDTDETVVTENVTSPEPHISISDVSCFGMNDGFIVIDSITNGKSPYLCSFDGSAFTDNKQFTNLSPGQHTLVIMDAAGCETEVSFNIGEPQEVTVEIQGDFEGNQPLVDIGEEVTLTVVTTPPFGTLDTVIWSPDSLINCPTCPQNDVVLFEQTTFSVTVVKNGCSDSDQLTIFVKKDHPVYLPNAFSPNDDGHNDVFMIYGGPQIAKVKSFLVFNRWGETVWEYYNFTPNDPATGWNGEHRGQMMDPGTFTWFAEVEFVDGLVEIFEGSVVLMN